MAACSAKRVLATSN